MSRSSQLASIAMVVLLALIGTACSATAEWIPAESAQDPAASTSKPAAPAELAFVEDEPTTEPTTPVQIEPEPVAASPDYCTATANSWIHSAALNRIGADSNLEMNRVAMANVAEWLERAVLLAPEDPVIDRAEMFEAFTELQAQVSEDFDDDWAGFQTSSAYANSEPARVYEAHRSALIPFVNERCDSLSILDMSAAATARTEELIAQFSMAASTLVESDSLPGHTIFTHGSGRLIASFPSAWSHQEGAPLADPSAIVDLVASPKLERFLNNEAVDGVRLQLVEAETLSDFEIKIADTMIATACTETSQQNEPSAIRISITRVFTCDDHSATIIGQYSETRSLGLIIEASFDSSEASRTDLIRLASIANSALWS